MKHAKHNKLHSLIHRLTELSSIVHPGFLAWYESFLTFMLYEKRKSFHTTLAYVEDWIQFLKFLYETYGCVLDHTHIASTSRAHLRTFLAMRMERGVSARSNARLLSALRSVMRYRAEGDKTIQETPLLKALYIVRTPRYSASLPRPLHEEEAQALLSACPKQTWIDHRNSALLYLLYATGLRIGEALSLSYRDWCSMKHSSAHGLVSVFKVQGKGAKERVVPLIPCVLEVLTRYIEACPYFPPKTPQFPLFLGKQGRVLQAGILQRHLRSMRTLLQLPSCTTPHSLRHSFASHTLQRGAELRALQEALGHASLSSTELYTQVDADRLHALVAMHHPRAKEGQN